MRKSVSRYPVLRFSSLYEGAARWLPLALLAVAAIPLMPTSVEAQSLQRLDIKMHIGPTATFAPVMYAYQTGCFRKGGVDAQIEDGTGSVATTNIVGNGHFDVGISDLSVVAQARNKGLPVRAIAVMLPVATAGFLVPRSSGIKTVKDLVGKRVILDSASQEAPFLDMFLKNGGITRSQFEAIQISGMAKISSYASGQGDALLTNAPVIEPLVEGTRPSNTIGFKDYGLGVLPSIGYFATDKTIASKAKALGVFVRCVAQAQNDIAEKGKVNEAVDAIIKNRPQIKLDPVKLTASLKSLVPYMSANKSRGKPYGWMYPEDWTAALKLMSDLKLMNSSHKPQEFYTNQFLMASQ